MDDFSRVSPGLRLGHRLARVLIIEDTPRKVERNYGNAISVRPWMGEQEDSELKNLTWYLPLLDVLSDVRQMEKRDWRNRVPEEQRFEPSDEDSPSQPSGESSG